MLRLNGPTRWHSIHRLVSRTANVSSSTGTHLSKLSHRTSHYVPPADQPHLLKRIQTHLTSLHHNGGGPTRSEVDAFNETISSLCASLEKDDVRGAWQHWSVLEKRKLTEFLGPSQLDLISRAIAHVFNSSRPYDEDEVQAIEELALVAAAYATHALNAVLIYHIKGNNPNAVLELDRRYTQLLLKRGDWKRRWSANEENELGWDTLASSTSAPDSDHSPGKNAHVQLAVTTAYAMQDSFEGALQAFLESSLPPFKLSLKSFLGRLHVDGSLRDKVKDYSRRLGTVRLVIRAPSFIKHITNLANDQSVDSLQKLYATIIEGLTGSNPYLAAHPKAADSKRIVLVPELAWSAFLSAFIKCQRMDLAETLWDDVIRIGIRPGTPLWTTLFDGYANMRAINDLLRGWDTMLSEGVVPNALTHRALISGLFNAKRPDEAMSRFRTFEKEKRSLGGQPEHILAVYNTVLHGLLQASREKEAFQLFQAMKDNGPPPCVISYNTIMGYSGRKGDFKAVAAHVRDMSSRGVVGDVFTFSTILSALLRVGREDAPEMMVNFMKKQGIEPNVATYSAIIDQQMREQSEDNLRAALRLLEEMERDPRTHPNEVTYTAILAGLYRGQWLDPGMAEEYRQDIMERMHNRGVRPNKVTYNILLKACLANSEPEGLQNALRYHREMVSRRILLDYDAWFVLLRGLTDRGEWEIAGEMTKEMVLSGFQPVGALAEVVKRIRKQTIGRVKVKPSE